MVDNLSVHSSLGLSLPSMTIKPIHGRKSYLLQAILRPSAEVAMSRQASLDRVLREKSTPDLVPP